MRSYEIRLDASAKNIAEQIEALQGIGMVELVFTVEAPTRAKAVKETLEVVNEFNASYRGEYTSYAEEERIRAGLKLVPVVKTTEKI